MLGNAKISNKSYTIVYKSHKASNIQRSKNYGTVVVQTIIYRCEHKLYLHYKLKTSRLY